MRHTKLITVRVIIAVLIMATCLLVSHRLQLTDSIISHAQATSPTDPRKPCDGNKKTCAGKGCKGETCTFPLCGYVCKNATTYPCGGTGCSTSPACSGTCGCGAMCKRANCNGSTGCGRLCGGFLCSATGGSCAGLCIKSFCPDPGEPLPESGTLMGCFCDCGAAWGFNLCKISGYTDWAGGQWGKYTCIYCLRSSGTSRGCGPGSGHECPR